MALTFRFTATENTCPRGTSPNTSAGSSFSRTFPSGMKSTWKKLNRSFGLFCGSNCSVATPAPGGMNSCNVVR